MKRVSLLYTVLIWTLLLTAAAAPAGAEDTAYIPMIGYELVSLDSQGIHSATAGGAVMGDEYTFVGLYTRHQFTKDLVPEDPALFFPSGYHSVDLLFDGGEGRHQLLTLFKSESDRPVYGGLSTFQAAVVYGYEVIAGRNLNLALGGGLAAGDFGIESPLLPVPFIRLVWESRLIDAGFDFITGPNLGFTLFPRHRLRLNGDMRMDQFRDSRDLIFETSLEYRFFDPDGPAGDFAGVSLGFKNDSLGFTSGKSGEEYEMHYYALFAELDLAILTLAGGYAFEGRERYGEDDIRHTGRGYFVSLQGLYQF
jgi:hypothetical protein